MIYRSPSADAIAFRTAAGLTVRGPGCEAQLTGRYAEDFLRAFLGEAPAGTLGALGALAALGRPEHRRLAELAHAGDGRPWVPLAAFRHVPLLFLEVTGRCNERCAHCYASASPDVTAGLERELCLTVIRDAHALGFGALQLTGGEALLCPFLPELAAEARRCGYSAVEVYTNGLALSEERLGALAPAAVAFAFSVYSHRAELHDRVTRVPGSHARTGAAIVRALAHGARVRVGITSVEPGAEHLERTVEWVRALGVPASHVNADVVRTVGRGAQLAGDGGDAAPAGAAAGAHTGAPAAEEAGQAPPVQWPGKLCVAYTGQVLPCIFSRALPLGDVRREPLADIVGRARARRAAAVVDPERLGPSLTCTDCRLTASMLGAGA